MLEMANGDKLSALGETVLPVEIGELKTDHRFIVADVSSGVILGADFLTQNRIDILLSESRLRWADGSIPVERTANTTPKTPCYRVALYYDIYLSSNYKEIIYSAGRLRNRKWRTSEGIDSRSL